MAGSSCVDGDGAATCRRATAPGDSRHDSPSDIARTARPGDIVLTSGQSLRHRQARRALGNPLWTQVGILIGSGEATDWLLISTLDPICPDARHGQVRPGVQTVSLVRFLRAFAGDVTLRRLEPALDPLRLAAADRIGRDLDGLPFKQSKMELLRSRARRNRRFDAQSFYCSELVAHVLQQLTIVTPPPVGRLPNNFIPDDFSEGRQNLDLCGASKYGPEVAVACGEAASPKIEQPARLFGPADGRRATTICRTSLWP